MSSELELPGDIGHLSRAVQGLCTGLGFVPSGQAGVEQDKLRIMYCALTSSPKPPKP